MREIVPRPEGSEWQEGIRSRRASGTGAPGHAPLRLHSNLMPKEKVMRTSSLHRRSRATPPRPGDPVDGPWFWRTRICASVVRVFGDAGHNAPVTEFVADIANGATWAAVTTAKFRRSSHQRAGGSAEVGTSSRSPAPVEMHGLLWRLRRGALTGPAQVPRRGLAPVGCREP